MEIVGDEVEVQRDLSAQLDVAMDAFHLGRKRSHDELFDQLENETEDEFVEIAVIGVVEGFVVLEDFYQVVESAEDYEVGAEGGDVFEDRGVGSS